MNWIHILGMVMLMVPFAVLFLGLAQTDGTPWALKSIAIATGAVLWVGFAAWLIVR